MKKASEVKEIAVLAKSNRTERWAESLIPKLLEETILCAAEDGRFEVSVPLLKCHDLYIEQEQEEDLLRQMNRPNLGIIEYGQQLCEALIHLGYRAEIEDGVNSERGSSWYSKGQRINPDLLKSIKINWKK